MVLAQLDLSRPAAQLFSGILRTGRTTITDALALWRSAHPVVATLTELYWVGRGLPCPEIVFAFRQKPTSRQRRDCFASLRLCEQSSALIYPSCIQNGAKKGPSPPPLDG